MARRVSTRFGTRLRRIHDRLLTVNKLIRGRIGSTIATLVRTSSNLTRRIHRVSSRVGRVRHGVSRRYLHVLTHHRPTTSSLQLVVDVSGSIVSLRHVNSRTAGVTHHTVRLYRRNRTPHNCIRIHRVNSRIHGVIHSTLSTFTHFSTSLTLSITRCSGVVSHRCGATLHRLTACVVRSPHSVSQILDVV